MLQRPTACKEKKDATFTCKTATGKPASFSLIWGVDYEVFCMDEAFDPKVFKAMMKTIQVKDFHPRYFSGQQEIHKV